MLELTYWEKIRQHIEEAPAYKDIEPKCLIGSIVDAATGHLIDGLRKLGHRCSELPTEGFSSKPFMSELKKQKGVIVFIPDDDPEGEPGWDGLQFFPDIFGKEEGKQ